jgi:anaerobic sulfite reductase subunit B
MATKEQIIRNSPYKPKLVDVIDYQRDTHDSFTIKLGWKLEHGAGQFVFCSLPGMGEAPISICSYSDEYVELNIREVGNVTKALSKIKKGSKLLVRGPYGKAYPMEDLKGNNAIVIGGGSGVAPLKGVVEYIEKKRKDFKDVQIFFGFRTPEDVIFKNNLDRWKDLFEMHISFDKIETHALYGGRQGFVTELVNEHVHDNRGKIVFICGPPIMIAKVAEILLGKGFNEDQIYISAERLMYCGIGKCGGCMIHGKYTCLDGAVFRYDELKEFKDD